MLLRTFFFISMAVFVHGCCHYPYRGRPYSVSQTDLGIHVHEAFLTDSVSPGEIDYEQWWHFFKDPQLSHFIELSLACHPDIKMAEARIRLACHEARIARSALFPHLYGVAQVQRQKISELGPGFVPGFPEVFTLTTLQLTSALYELDIWQKNRSLYCSALDQMRASIANYEEAKLLLSTAIAAIYFDLQMQLARKEVTMERLKARQELYSLHKQQFDLGIISEFRLYQVDTDIQLLKDLIFQLNGEIAIDQHALSALVGNVACVCGAKADVNVPPAAHFDQPFPLPVTLPIDLLARRPDITAATWIVEAACYDIKAARADFLPRIDLLGWIGFQSIRFDQLFSGKTLIALGQATATLPLFTAGKLRAQLGVAHETLEIAIEKYNQTVLDAVQQVSDALTNLVTADERKKSITKAMQDASALLELTKERYENAISNKLAVLNAFENLYLQRDLEVQIQLERYASAVELIRAIGGGYYAYCR